MKIGFDAKRIFYNATGLGNYSRELLQMLMRYYAGNSYYLYTFKEKKDYLNNLDLESVHLRMPKGFPAKLSSFLWRSFSVANQIKQDRLDLYHGLSQELPFNIRKTGVKTLITVHDLIFLRYPKFYDSTESIIYNYKTKKALKSADAVIATSEQTKKDLIEFYRYPSDRIEVLYQGCHELFEQAPDLQKQAKVRIKYSLPEVYVLSVGTLEPRKNLLTLLKAIASLSVSLVVVGHTKTAYGKKVKSYVKHFNMEDRVHFLERVPLEDLPSIYQMACVFCYPSFFEGFGIPILEALHSRIPVVTSKGSCFAEVGGPGSFYVNPDSYEDLNMVLNELLRDKNIRDQSIESGTSHVKNFSKERLAEGLIKIYNKVLS